MTRKRRTPADEPFILVRSLAQNFGAGRTIARHAHDWHQLIYASAGVLTVWTERGSWVAPPHMAIWVPGGIAHSIRFAGESALRTLYLRPDGQAGLPGQCAAIAVSPLLRELILRTARAGMLDERDPAEAAIATLIADEFRQSGAPPFELPQPTSPPTRRAAALIAAGAPEAAGMASLARATGLGMRALERRFRAETGMSPGRWRRQHILLGALERLAGNEPIKAIAAAAGYATPSAFTAAFRAAFGITPARYFQPR
jgi:AraC-like DNA-binding protein